MTRLMVTSVLLIAPTSAFAADKTGTVVELDGLKSTAPADWVKERPTSNLRVAQFKIPKVEGDPRDAELIIFYFQGQGGSVADNLKRWKGMFLPPEGKSIDDVAKVEKMKAGAVPIVYLDISGTYKYKRAPMVPDAQAELRPDHRMLSVYFDSKDGPYFIRLVGPAKTVAHHKKAFDDWLKAFK